MKTKKQVLDLANSLDVVMEDVSGGMSWGVTFFTDDDRLFESSDASCLSVHWYVTPTQKPSFWQECYDELKEGVK